MPEARRYFIGIVGKYGVQVQAVLKKAAASGHRDRLQRCTVPSCIRSSWAMCWPPTTPGVPTAPRPRVCLSPTAASTATLPRLPNRLAEALRDEGRGRSVAMDLARCDMAEAVAQAFRFSKLVLATPTYNADVFPFMKELHPSPDRAQLPEPHGGLY